MNHIYVIKYNHRLITNKCIYVFSGCIYRGIPYPSGSEWADPEDPCKTYKCVASVVTETTMKCFNQCDDEHVIPPKPGECCPTCQGKFL